MKYTYDKRDSSCQRIVVLPCLTIVADCRHSSTYIVIQGRSSE